MNIKFNAIVKVRPSSSWLQAKIILGLSRKNSFLILHLGLNIFCNVRGFNLEPDGLPP